MAGSRSSPPRGTILGTVLLAGLLALDKESCLLGGLPTSGTNSQSSLYPFGQGGSTIGAARSFPPRGTIFGALQACGIRLRTLGDGGKMLAECGSFDLSLTSLALLSDRVDCVRRLRIPLMLKDDDNSCILRFGADPGGEIDTADGICLPGVAGYGS